MSIPDRTQQHLYELNTESRLTKLESTNEAILKTLVDVNHSINKLETRIDKALVDVNQSINRLDAKIDKVAADLNSKIDKLDSRLWGILFIIIGGFLGKVFHWF